MERGPHVTPKDEYVIEVHWTGGPPIRNTVPVAAQMYLMEFTIEHQPWTFSEDFRAFLEEAARQHTGKEQPTAADKAAVLYEGNMASAIVDLIMQGLQREGYVECRDDDGAAWTLMPHALLGIRVTIPDYPHDRTPVAFRRNAPTAATANE
jgi:hypothetical protein